MTVKKRKSLLLSLTPPIILVLIITSFAAISINSQNSTLWGDNGELHSPTSRLPSFAFAGYHSGEKAIPNNIPVVTNAADFGAVGDGITDDTAAIRNAINATNNGALLIPAGKYKITSRISFQKSNIVIRGAGQDQTTIYMPQSISTLEGLAELPYGGAFFQIGNMPSSGSLVGSLSTNANRGDFSVTLSAPPAVTVGQSVRLVSNNDNDLGVHLLAGQAVGSRTPLEFNSYTDTVLKVQAITGNTITFDRPLRLDARPEWNSQIRTYSPSITEFGMEDLTFEMGGTPKKAHNDEEGFNAIDMKGAHHSWIRRVTFIDADNCILINNTRFCEFSDLTFKAVLRGGTDTGHHALWAKTFSQANLFTRFNIQTTFVHELSVEGLAHANVFSDGFASRLRLDHHANLPYENLFTDLRTANIGNLYVSGGSSVRKPHTAARSTIWNITTTAGNPPAIPNWPLFNVIGVTGYSPSTSGSGSWVEPIANINPPNLHLAQLNKRLGIAPTSGEAVIEATAISGDAPLLVNFSGLSSSIDGTTISSYQWDFGDGTTSTGPTASHSFAAGTHTVCLTIVGNNGEQITKALEINAGSITSFQAEDATLTNASVESNNAGFNEAGFVNLQGSASTIEWDNIPGGVGGATTITFRFALGNSPRTVTLNINGNTQNITFPTTGSWTTWDNFTVNTNLNPGNNNTVSITTIGQDSANIDELSVPAASAQQQTYAQWLASQNLGGNANLQDPNLDFDGDGMTNGLEWALGTPPTSANHDPAYETIITQTSIKFIYSKSHPGIVSQLQESLDLVNWADANNTPEQFSTANEKYFVEIPMNTQTADKRFYRMKFPVQ